MTTTKCGFCGKEMPQETVSVSFSVSFTVIARNARRFLYNTCPECVTKLLTHMGKEADAERILLVVDEWRAEYAQKESAQAAGDRPGG